MCSRHIAVQRGAISLPLPLLRRSWWKDLAPRQRFLPKSRLFPPVALDPTVLSGHQAFANLLRRTTRARASSTAINRLTCCRDEPRQVVAFSRRIQAATRPRHLTSFLGAQNDVDRHRRAYQNRTRHVHLYIEMLLRHGRQWRGCTEVYFLCTANCLWLFCSRNNTFLHFTATKLEKHPPSFNNRGNDSSTAFMWLWCACSTTSGRRRTRPTEGSFRPSMQPKPWTTARTLHWA